MKYIICKLIEWFISVYVRRKPDKTNKEIDKLKKRIEEIDREMATTDSNTCFNLLCIERLQINQRIATLSKRLGKTISIETR